MVIMTYLWIGAEMVLSIWEIWCKAAAMLSSPPWEVVKWFCEEGRKTHTCIGAKTFTLSRKILLQGCLKQHLAEMRARVHEKKSFIFSQKWSLWHTCASVQNCFRNAVTLKQGYCKPYLISMGRGLLLIFIWRLSHMLVLRSDISYKLLGQNQYATYELFKICDRADDGQW